MSEEIFIRHCSPTMAGIKTANLFSSRFEDEMEMKESIRSLNKDSCKERNTGSSASLSLWLWTYLCISSVKAFAGSEKQRCSKIAGRTRICFFRNAGAVYCTANEATGN